MRGVWRGGDGLAAFVAAWRSAIAVAASLPSICCMVGPPFPPAKPLTHPPGLAVRGDHMALPLSPPLRAGPALAACEATVTLSPATTAPALPALESAVSTTLSPPTPPFSVSLPNAPCTSVTAVASDAAEADRWGVAGGSGAGNGTACPACSNGGSGRAAADTDRTTTPSTPDGSAIGDGGVGARGGDLMIWSAGVRNPGLISAPLPTPSPTSVCGVRGTSSAATRARRGSNTGWAGAGVGVALVRPSSALVAAPSTTSMTLTGSCWCTVLRNGDMARWCRCCPPRVTSGECAGR